MSPRRLLRKIALSASAGALAVAFWHVLAVPLLNITFDASSIALERVATLATGTGDEPILMTAFLTRVEKIQSFAAPDADADTNFPWADPAKLGGPITLSPPQPPSVTCDSIRIEPSRAEDGVRAALSLHVDARDGQGSCQLLLRSARDGTPYPLKAGARLDFVLKPVAPSTEAVTIIENVAAGSLKAAMRGAMAGVDLGTCSHGRNLDISGHPLDIATITLSKDGTALTAWARSRLVTQLDVDGSKCVGALFTPKSLIPLVVFVVAYGLVWALLK